jgi:hypothetical protein
MFNRSTGFDTLSMFTKRNENDCLHNSSSARRSDAIKVVNAAVMVVLGHAPQPQMKLSMSFKRLDNMLHRTYAQVLASLCVSSPDAVEVLGCSAKEKAEHRHGP